MFCFSQNTLNIAWPAELFSFPYTCVSRNGNFISSGQKQKLSPSSFAQRYTETRAMPLPWALEPNPDRPAFSHTSGTILIYFQYIPNQIGKAILLTGRGGP